MCVSTLLASRCTSACGEGEEALGWVSALLLVLMAGGAALRYWCYAKLGRYFTYTILVKPDHVLVADGPYALLLHPSYTAQVGVMCLYLLYMFGACAVYLLPLVAYKLRQRMAIEEKHLHQTLPARRGLPPDALAPNSLRVLNAALLEPKLEPRLAAVLRLANQRKAAALQQALRGGVGGVGVGDDRARQLGNAQRHGAAAVAAAPRSALEHIANLELSCALHDADKANDAVVELHRHRLAAEPLRHPALGVGQRVNAPRQVLCDLRIGKEPLHRRGFFARLPGAQRKHLLCCLVPFFYFALARERAPAILFLFLYSTKQPTAVELLFSTCLLGHAACHFIVIHALAQSPSDWARCTDAANDALQERVGALEAECGAAADRA